MTDQQRSDQVGFSSNGHFETPHLDALAESGVVFDNAYSASTFCVPARNALLTGLLPHRIPTQINGLALREGFWTVAHVLRQAGYETALIGKMHFAPVHAEHGFETMRLCEHLHSQGIPREEGDEELSDDYHEWLLSQGFDDWRFKDGELIQKPPRGPFPYEADLHPTGWIERETLTFLAQRKRDRPLFLVVSFPHPHEPYNPPEPYASLYDPADSRLPRTTFEVNAALPQLFVEEMTTFGGRPTPRVDPNDPGAVLEFLALVRGLVKQIDDSIGSILERLDRANSVVFFTSDHGDYAGNRGMLRKFPWIPYDDLARVPLVVAGPDVSGRRRWPDLVQSCDIALTCLDYAGVDLPPGIDFGTRSLRPLLTDAAASKDVERAVFCGTNRGWSMVRRGRYKYVRKVWTVSALFDLADDPDESVNLGDDPAYQEILAELRGLLDDQLQLAIPELPAFT
jgi:choline-sulfatase